MKTVVSVVLVALTVIALTGCISNDVSDFERVSIKREENVDPPRSLETVIKDNDFALDLAVSDRDFLLGDRYLEYIGFAKDRDDVDNQQARLAVLTEAVNKTQAAFSQVMQSASNQLVANNSAGSGSTNVSQPAPAPGSQTTVNTPPVTTTNTNLTVTETYTDSDNGFSITYPNDWVKGDATIADISSVLVVSPMESADDQFLENVSVTAEPLLEETNIDDYLDLALAGVTKNLPGFSELDRKDETLDGGSAKRVVYSYTSSGQKVKAIFYVRLKGFRGYVIVGTTSESQFDAKAELLEEVCRSFKII